VFCEINLENMKPELYIRGRFEFHDLDNMKASHTVVKLTETAGIRPKDLKDSQGTLFQSPACQDNAE
jgi:hypothetical protein